MTRIQVNGAAHEVEADPQTPLLYVLRDDLGLHGAKFGCGLGQCGACTVLLDGRPVFSCLTPVGLLGDRKVVTLEGLGTPERPGVLQQAFITEQAAQCGYCIPGMIVRAQALLDTNPRASDGEIRRHMQPNLCRCGTHVRILRAIRRAANQLLRQDAKPAGPETESTRSRQTLDQEGPDTILPGTASISSLV